MDRMDWINLGYLVAALGFAFSLKWMSDAKTARRGVLAGEIGFAIAIVATLFHEGITSTGYILIAIALVIGTIIGIPFGTMVPMTSMPERIALSHAFGGLAAGLVGVTHYYLERHDIGWFEMLVTGIEVTLGFLVFTGSLMAAGKLVGWLPQRPIVYPGQNYLNFAVLGVALALVIWLVVDPSHVYLIPIIVALGLLFGFLLIVAGSLDGASGLILSIIMCRAMNRSFSNVLFGAFGAVDEVAAGDGPQGTVRSATTDEAGELLKNARSVVVVPGYGMAVAQAQHKVRELADALEEEGVDVRFAIHPVAGRMPGHMNVLLAEANVPYEQLLDMDEINDDFPQVDVVLVLGANDVVNPAARENPNSPIYGMPVLNVDQAGCILVVKRSMNAGFAGIENELFFNEKTMMVFGDAKNVVGELTSEVTGKSDAISL